MAGSFQHLDRLMEDLDPAVEELLAELAGGKGSTAAPDVRANAKVQAVMNILMTQALDRHAAALAHAARVLSDAADRHGTRLFWGNLALVAATLALLAEPFITFWLHGGSN